MDIQVGMYVRTKVGEIRKIVSIETIRDEVCYKVDKIVKYYVTKDKVTTNNDMYLRERDIKKASFNLIDLIGLIEERRLCEWCNG